MEKILTLIIPTYNMEKYLHRCLSSLVAPSSELMNALEVLVVNDGSKDGSSAIGHDFENRYFGTIKVIDKENGNYGSCINAALPVAKGKYVKVLDADDWFDNAAFSQFLQTLFTLDVDLVLTDFAEIDEKGQFLQSHSFAGTLSSERELSFPEMVHQGFKAYVPMHHITYRTENLKKIGYRQTEGISYTDVEWTFLPMKTVETARYVPLCLYQYLVGREGQTVDPKQYAKQSSHMEKMLFSILSKYDENIDPLHRQYLEDVIKTEICIIYFKGLAGLFPEDFLSRIDARLKAEHNVFYEKSKDYVIGGTESFHPIEMYRVGFYSYMFRILKRQGLRQMLKEYHEASYLGFSKPFIGRVLDLKLHQ